MRAGRHAAGDGSFGRSASAAAGRGFVLLAVALALGIVLLNAADDAPPGESLASTSSGDNETRDPRDVAATTTTAAGPTTTTAPARAPKDVKVLVANGTKTKGAAAKVSDLLKPGGYNVLAPTDAPAATTSSVFFTAGFDREAAGIATALQLPATVVKAMPAAPPVPNPAGANVIVVVGAELANRVAPTTSTTAARATTTTARPTATTTTAPATTTTKRP